LGPFNENLGPFSEGIEGENGDDNFGAISGEEVGSGLNNGEVGSELNNKHYRLNPRNSAKQNSPQFNLGEMIFSTR